MRTVDRPKKSQFNHKIIEKEFAFLLSTMLFKMVSWLTSSTIYKILNKTIIKATKVCSLVAMWKSLFASIHEMDAQKKAVPVLWKVTYHREGMVLWQALEFLADLFGNRTGTHAVDDEVLAYVMQKVKAYMFCKKMTNLRISSSSGDASCGRLGTLFSPKPSWCDIHPKIPRFVPLELPSVLSYFSSNSSTIFIKFWFDICMYFDELLGVLMNLT